VAAREQIRERRHLCLTIQACDTLSELLQVVFIEQVERGDIVGSTLEV